MPSNPETAKEASLLWHPEHGAPLTIPFSSLSALTYGYNSNTFRAALEADEDLEAEWRCFSVYQGDGGAARSGGSEEVRALEADATISRFLRELNTQDWIEIPFSAVQLLHDLAQSRTISLSWYTVY